MASPSTLVASTALAAPLMSTTDEADATTVRDSTSDAATTMAGGEVQCCNGDDIAIDSDEERPPPQHCDVTDEPHDDSDADDALHCSSSSDDAVAMNTTTTTTTTTRTMTPATRTSALNIHNVNNPVDTMHTVDETRHRLKRPSTAPTLGCSDGSTNTISSSRRRRSASALESPARMSGFLRMRESAREWRMKTWYCVLYNTHVYWYASKKDAQVAKRLRGQVRVVNACASAGAGKMHVYPNAFVFTAKNGQVYFCSAPTPEAQQQWLASMNAASVSAPIQPPASDASLRTVSSSDSTGGSSRSSLAALESLPEDTVANGAGTIRPALQHSASASQSFRRARATERLELHMKTPTDLACVACDLEFSALRRRRHVCSSCGHGFCRWHCAQYVPLERSESSATAGTYVARVCDACAQRQHFITFAVALTSNMVARLADADADDGAAFALLCTHDCFHRDRATEMRRRRSSAAASYSAEPQCHRRQWRELQTLVTHRASFTALNLMCFLKKYERMPWLFARTLCLFIAVVETDAAGLSEYWNQFLALFVPLIDSVYPELEYDAATLEVATAAAASATTDDYVHVTSDEQLASLNLYIDVTLAICRRVPALALRTVWECLALFADAQQRGRRVCANYVMLLVYLVSAFDGDSELVENTWLRDAPAAQADALVAAMDDYLRVANALSERAPRSLALQWIHATRERNQQRWTHRIERLLRGFAVDERLPALEILKLFSPVAVEGEALFGTVIGSSSDDDDDEVDADTDRSLTTQSMRDRERQFNAEANFVHNLTAIAEHLRFVPSVAARPRALPALLQQLQQTLGTGVASLSNPQYLPLATDSSSSSSTSATMAPKILRVVLDEGKVFSTRCRAPTMIVFEALTSELADLSVDDDDDDDDDDDVDDMWNHDAISRAAAVPTSTSQRTLARQDSEMLDRLLCSFDKSAVASLINGDSSPRESSSSSVPSPLSASASSLLLSELEDERHDIVGSDVDDDANDVNDDDDVENEPLPEEMAKEDARLVYEESTSMCMLVDEANGAAAADSDDSSGDRDRDQTVAKRSSSSRQSTETWAAKAQRIRAASEFGDLPGWTLVSVIAKSFDDLRQEVFALQLMTTLQAIFHGNDLDRLYLRPYRILCTGANVGLIETLTDALSIDAVKKQHGSLWRYFRVLFGDERSVLFRAAREAFAASMAASSIFCYLFQIKDRHNGNIMLDRAGHIMHIDFGFILGIMPGGAFSLEKDGPFKLTVEMVELMGGLESANYATFRKLFLDGMLAVRREYVKLLSLIHLTAADSPFPCFQSQSPGAVLAAFRRRLFLEYSDAAASTLILRLVDKSYNNWGMRQYDKFQRSTNGILP